MWTDVIARLELLLLLCMVGLRLWLLGCYDWVMPHDTAFFVTSLKVMMFALMKPVKKRKRMLAMVLGCPKRQWMGGG